MTHHGQCTDDLSQGGLESVEIGRLRGITEEAIKHLLDLGKVVLNFSGDLSNQQLFLCLARHGVERW